MLRSLIVAPALLVCLASSVSAAYVQPSMGGAQVAQGTAGMKHADIAFDGQSLTVAIDDSVATPVLRPLVAPDEFDPDGPWGAINGKAYNFQYGWNPSRFDEWPPNGSWVWIEQLEASPGLEVYQRPPAAPTGEPIFGTAGSSARWRWSGAMTHNLYAIDRPTEESYEAVYRVYIGDDATGNPTPGYGPALVTFQFLATPILQGDYNRDSVVDVDDYSLWRETYGQSGPDIAADGNGDQVVDTADYSVWRDHVTPLAPALESAATPEPTSAWLLAVVSCLCFTRRPASTENCPGQRATGKSTSAHT